MRRVVDFVYRHYWKSGIADDVPALTYYLVVCLAPFALGMAALATILLGDRLSPPEVASTLRPVLPRQIHEPVITLVSTARHDSPALLAVAVAAMLWTSSGAIGVIERCLSRLLDAPRYPMILGKLRNLALGLLVAVLLVSSAFAGTISGGIADRLPFDVGNLPLAVVVHLAGATVLCALIYRFAPRVRMSWTSAFEGAMPVACVLQSAPLLVGWFLGSGSASAPKLFAGVAALVAACHLLSQALLLGAGLACGRERRKTGIEPAGRAE